jgi:hypothetical protein
VAAVCDPVRDPPAKADTERESERDSRTDTPCLSELEILLSGTDAVGFLFLRRSGAPDRPLYAELTTRQLPSGRPQDLLILTDFGCKFRQRSGSQLISRRSCSNPDLWGGRIQANRVHGVMKALFAAEIILRDFDRKRVQAGAGFAQVHRLPDD